MCLSSHYFVCTSTFITSWVARRPVLFLGSYSSDLSSVCSGNPSSSSQLCSCCRTVCFETEDKLQEFWSRSGRCRQVTKKTILPFFSSTYFLVAHDQCAYRKHIFVNVKSRTKPPHLSEKNIVGFFQFNFCFLWINNPILFDLVERSISHLKSYEINL